MVDPDCQTEILSCIPNTIFNCILYKWLNYQLRYAMIQQIFLLGNNGQYDMITQTVLLNRNVILNHLQFFPNHNHIILLTDRITKNSGKNFNHVGSDGGILHQCISPD